MLEMGRTRYRSKASLEVARMSVSPPGRRLLSEAVPSLLDTLEKALHVDRLTSLEHWMTLPGAQHCQWVQAGRPPASRWASLILLTNLEVSCTLALKAILDHICFQSSQSMVCMAIANAIETEARFGHRMLKAEPWLWRETYRRTKHARYANKVKTFKKVEGDALGKAIPKLLPWQPWDHADRLSVGLFLLHLAVKATGLVAIQTVKKTYRSGSRLRYLYKNYVVATPETLKWINDYNASHELMEPVRMPMVTPPHPWVPGQIIGGGYGVIDTALDVPLIKSPNKRYLQRAAKASMPAVWNAMNGIQDTPWRINKRVLDVVKHMWNVTRLPVADLPKQDDVIIPPRPAKCDTDPEARRKWGRSVWMGHRTNDQNRSKRISVSKVLMVAERFKDHPKFWFPTQMDFRGRIYMQPLFLNPQGPDVARGLLEFAEGKPLDTEDARMWFVVAGANLFGKAKGNIESRKQWVWDNIQAIWMAGEDPLRDMWWTEADKPFQFLAWCMEVHSWTTITGNAHDPNFVSHLPIQVDASNNGLQILSLLMRDPVGGKATNCIHSELPCDLYQEVADKVITELKVKLMSEDPADALMAEQWLSLGVSRKTVKRPVMVLPYGGTKHSCREYIEDWLKETADKKPTGWLPWEPDRLFAPTMWFTRIVWNCIKDTVGAAQVCMDYLQECAAVVSRNNNAAIRWVAPSGFPVMQAYHKKKLRRVTLWLQNINVFVKGIEQPRMKPVDGQIRVPTTKMDNRKMSDGVSPNFVHSLDAACLAITVDRLCKEGVSSFSMIHDSYGTHARDMALMQRTLREVWSEVFTQDLLQAFHNEVLSQVDPVDHHKLPSVPTTGEMKVDSIKDALYFFI